MPFAQAREAISEQLRASWTTTNAALKHSLFFTKEEIVSKKLHQRHSFV